MAGLGTLAGSAQAVTLLTNADTQVQFSARFTGGYFEDQALDLPGGDSASQTFKLTDLSAAFDVTHEAFLLHVEPVLLADQAQVGAGGINDTTYATYDRNAGTSLVFTGNTPLRQAYLAWGTNDQRVAVGRQYSFYGVTHGLDALYTTRLDAPEQYYIDTELMTGVRYTVSTPYVQWDVGVLSGRARPVEDFEVASTNDSPNAAAGSPAFESRFMVGNDAIKGYVGYRHHTLDNANTPDWADAAPHVDNRLVVGALTHFGAGPVVVDGWAQVGNYTTGFTTASVHRRGGVVAAKVSWQGWYAELTSERLSNEGAFFDYLRMQASASPVLAPAIDNTLSHHAWSDDTIAKIGYRWGALDVSGFFRWQSPVLAQYSTTDFTMQSANKLGVIVSYAIE